MMPYNNSPIPPSEEITGKVKLPLTRVKALIRQDSEVQACSKNAALAITIATEMFIRYLTQQAYHVVKSEHSKPRTNIQYRDVAAAVARIDNLEFLVDVVPRPISVREYKVKKAKATAKRAALPPHAPNPGQTTMDGRLRPTAGPMGPQPPDELLSEVVSEEGPTSLGEDSDLTELEDETTSVTDGNREEEDDDDDAATHSDR